MKKITKIKKVTASSKTKISEDVLKEKKEIREPENHDSDNITEKTIMLDSVNQLEINLSSMNLRVNFGDENKVHYKTHRSLEPTVTQADGKLRIISEKNCTFFIFRMLYENYVEITLNKKQLYDVDVKISSGNISFDGLDISGKTETASGNTEIKNVNNGKSLNIKTASGNINLESCSFNEITEKQISGNSHFDDVTADKIYIKSTSGNTNIDSNICDMDIESCSGNVNLTLKGSENDCNYNLSVCSGTLKINGNSFDKKYSQNNNADKNIKCSLTSGNIKINFN